ncbi:siphovirus ReqiPepy6 Gp37-like family protein [Romboutsia lituseburensis]|uniref:siphovirus ReqiPepy6 Gp37-like family protein n=1 Tax=Romboutsia lituseburensis TaxID=1537 RepID=UPI00215AB406|nr:siphovirus ReqiPepy6 Gp37-like family protein [Romboutsia lituseburensis]MCR8744334.1 siphovirus ReqiPepy6 Gp37-like family protein [Romboutsia lituseburensis]
MKSIRILDKDINLLGEIDNYEEFKLNRRFFGLSEFELKIKVSNLHTDKLITNNLIVLDKDYKNVGIILHKEFNGVENKSDVLLVKGVTLKGLINRKLIIPDINQSYEMCKGKQETIIKHFVNKNCVKTVDPFRKTGRLVIAEDKFRGNDDSWRSSYDNLSEKIKEICEYCGLGWDVTLNPKEKQFIFDVIESKDLTINQNVNPPVIFRSDFNNIVSRNYIESIINAKNVVYSGTKDDASKIVLSTGESSGFERTEVFASINSDDIEEIKKEGQVKLKEFEELKSFELDINATNTFIYKKDYDLGDLVTIQDRSLRVTMNSKIVETEEVYNKNGMSLKITFGSTIPTILTKIKDLEKKVI